MAGKHLCLQPAARESLMPGKCKSLLNLKVWGHQLKLNMFSNSSLPLAKHQKSLLWFILSNSWEVPGKNESIHGPRKHEIWSLTPWDPGCLLYCLSLIQQWPLFLITQTRLTHDRFGVWALELPWEFHVCTCVFIALTVLCDLRLYLTSPVRLKDAPR